MNMVCLVLVVMVAEVRGAVPQRAYPAEGSYAVVTSSDTWKASGWREAAEAVRRKYDADLIVCDGSVLDACAELTRISPN